MEDQQPIKQYLDLEVDMEVALFENSPFDTKYVGLAMIFKCKEKGGV